MIFVKKYRYQKIETTDSLVVLPFGEHKMQIAFTITVLTHHKHQGNVGDTKLQLIK